MTLQDTRSCNNKRNSLATFVEAGLLAPKYTRDALASECHTFSGLLRRCRSVVGGENYVGVVANSKVVDLIDHRLDSLSVRPVLVAPVRLEFTWLTRDAIATRVGGSPRSCAWELTSGRKRICAVVLLGTGINGAMTCVQVKVNVKWLLISGGVANEVYRQIFCHAVNISAPPLLFWKDVPRCGANVQVFGAAGQTTSVQWACMGCSEIIPVLGRRRCMITWWRATSQVPLSDVASAIAVGLHQRPNVEQSPSPRGWAVASGSWQLKRKPMSWVLGRAVSAHIDVTVETHITCKSPSLLDQQRNISLVSRDAPCD